jgi:hypothetical protein
MHVRVGVLTAVFSIMIASTVFRLEGLPWWTGIGWASLSFFAAAWLRARANRSTARVVEAIQAEPMSASRAAVLRGPSALKPFFI